MASDVERSAILAGYEITVIRFSNQEVLNNFEGVCQQIEAALSCRGDLIPQTV